MEPQQVPPQQVLPEQHSPSPLQVPSPLGIQLTQVPLDSSQIPEQHWVSLVQEPVVATQQVPLLHIWPLLQSLLLQHCLQVPLQQCWPLLQLPSVQHWAQMPLQQFWPSEQVETHMPWLMSHVRH